MTNTVNLEIRSITKADLEALSELVCESFLELSSSDWAENAVQKLIEDSTPIALSKAVESAFYSAIALRNGAIAGMVLLSKPNILKMLFVNPKLTRNGVGRALWEHIRFIVEAEASTIELNSTNFAIPFYRAMGFVPISQQFEIDGAKMTRMACWLRARNLKAEIDG